MLTLLLKPNNGVYTLQLTPHGEMLFYYEKRMVTYIHHCANRIAMHSDIKKNLYFRKHGLPRTHVDV